MEIQKIATAGTLESSDIMVTLIPAEGGGVEIELDSSVEKQFGAKIRKTIAETLKKLEVGAVKVKAVDKGALDCTIRARVKTGRFARMRRDGLQMGEGAQMKQLRRTMLYVPGNNPGMVMDAGIYNSDCIMFDLEDSVSLKEKDSARFLVYEALTTLDYPGKELVVRINSLDTDMGISDLEAMVRTGEGGHPPAQNRVREGRHRLRAGDRTHRAGKRHRNWSYPHDGRDRERGRGT